MTRRLDIVLILTGAVFVIAVSCCRGGDGARELPVLAVPASVTSSVRIARIDAWFRKLQERRQFNGGVLIACDGKALLMKAYGFAEPDGKRKLTTDTPLRLASVSKQFTAAGVLILVHRRKLSLDTPVATYLKAFPYPKVTVRQLLNQTSGIPDVYMELAEAHEDECGDVLSIEDVVRLIRKYGPPLDTPPGASYRYSNTDYLLLAGLVEVVTAQSFERFMQEALFGPLGMTRSRVWNLRSTIPFPDRAADLSGGARPKRLVPSWIDGVAGDGGVFSSMEDMLRWESFWFGHKLLPKKIVREAFRAPKLANGDASEYGFGWILEDAAVWHNGEWLGARTYVERNLDDGTWVVLLDNSSNPDFDAICEALLAALEKQ